MCSVFVCRALARGLFNTNSYEALPKILLNKANPNLLYSGHLYLSHPDLNFDQRNILYVLSAIKQLNINQLLLICAVTKYCFRKLGT